MSAADSNPEGPGWKWKSRSHWSSTALWAPCMLDFGRTSRKSQISFFCCAAPNVEGLNGFSCNLRTRPPTSRLSQTESFERFRSAEKPVRNSDAWSFVSKRVQNTELSLSLQTSFNFQQFCPARIFNDIERYGEGTLCLVPRLPPKAVCLPAGWSEFALGIPGDRHIQTCLH